MTRAPREGDLVCVETIQEVAYGTFLGYGWKYVRIVDDHTGQERRVYGQAGVRRIGLLERLAVVSSDP